ncbi:MAG TPA: hypothetical protein VFV87_05005 [Pirellulaceae bacterium]|nr:hypothetical protein [Pirellulaceae bacterium]
MFANVALAACLACGADSDVLFSESFDDAELAKRAWYDVGAVRIAGDAAAGKACLEYEWVAGKDNVQGSSPMRRLFEPSDRVHVRFDLKLSEGFGWSGRSYHPHLINLLTTENGKWHGPAASRLTLYIEPVGGKLRLAAQDIQNKDAPHGLTQGPLRGGYNGKFYDSEQPVFLTPTRRASEGPTPTRSVSEGVTIEGWHRVEAYFQLNTLDLAADKPNRDGIVRGWFDGKLVVEHLDIVFRTTDFPKMQFNQFFLGPYFGPGLLPHSQKLWIDELAVARERPANEQ